MSQVTIASFGATATQVGSAVLFSAVAEETRADADPPPSFDADVTFNVGILDGIEANPRWTGARLTLEGDDVNRAGYFGALEIDQSFSPNEQRQMKFQPVGEPWAVPSLDYVPPDSSAEGPPAPPASDTAAPSPRLWGNKAVELFLSFGASPRTVKEKKFFQGVALQKQNKGDTVITGQVVCVDDGIRYANIPVCYQIPPFFGLHRGEITRQIALSIGVPAGKVIVPLGHLVTKPVLLSNASILPFLNEFWGPENGFAYFDELGNLRVEIVDMKTNPDWEIDLTNGDYYLDDIDETPPSLPPSRYYATATQPIKGSGPGGTPETDTTVTTTEQTGPYNPKCFKVRPSGKPSFLQGDGSYTAFSSAQELTIGRTVIEVTTVDGLETLRVQTEYGFYNPLRYAKWIDATAPPTYYFDNAYGDKTFHRDEVESLMSVKTTTTESIYDDNGTLLKTIQTVQGWKAPQRAGNYDFRRMFLTNAPPFAYIFPDGTTRDRPEEEYLVTDRIERSYTFDPTTGFLTSDADESYGWTSPSARADVVVDQSLVPLAEKPVACSNRPDRFGPTVGTDPGSILIYRHDFKYSTCDWRADVAETFQLVSKRTTAYTVANNQISRAQVATYSYANPLAAAGSYPFEDGPPYWYGTTFRRDPVDTFQLTSTSTITYEAYGPGSFLVTVVDVDALTGAITRTTSIQQGTAPLPTTINSALSRLILQPIVGTLVDNCITEHFVSFKKAVSLPWAETIEEVQTQLRRMAQRDSAIVRTLGGPWNPLIRIGQTVHVVDPVRLIDGNHLVVQTQGSRDGVTGVASMKLTGEFWTR